MISKERQFVERPASYFILEILRTEGEIQISVKPGRECLCVLKQWSPTFLTPGTGLKKDHFSTNSFSRPDGFGMIQVHYIYFALSF